jgi:hypothetical protein
MRHLLSRRSNQNITEQTPRDSKHEPPSDTNDSSKLRMFPLPLIRRGEGKVSARLAEGETSTYRKLLETRRTNPRGNNSPNLGRQCLPTF